MKLRDRLGLSLINIVVVLSGLILLLVMGYFVNPTLRTLLEAVGTSLIAAGFISYLIRRFYSEQQREAIEVIAERRVTRENEDRRIKYSAKEVDIVGIALSRGLKELATDSDQRMLKRILFENARVRLMFLNPLAIYAEQRAVEDGVPVAELRKILKQSMVYCVAIHERLQKLYQSAVDSKTLQRSKTGSLEIRVIDMCPHFTIYRTDELLLWGIYTSAFRGLDSAVLRVPREQDILFGQLSTHFSKLWDKSLSGPSGSNCLVRYYDPHVPTLNQEILKKVLGSNWKSYCSKQINRM